jgi:hypothetical protein
MVFLALPLMLEHVKNAIIRKITGGTVYPGGLKQSIQCQNTKDH